MSRFVRGRTPFCGANWGTNPNKKTLRREFFYSRLEGFEPPTFWFVAKRSIQLGYKRASDYVYKYIKKRNLFKRKYLKIKKVNLSLPFIVIKILLFKIRISQIVLWREYARIYTSQPLYGL